MMPMALASSLASVNSRATKPKAAGEASASPVRSSFDRATEAGGRHSRGHFDCLVKVVRLEKILAALAATRDGLGNRPATP